MPDDIQPSSLVAPLAMFASFAWLCWALLGESEVSRRRRSK